MEWTFIRRMCKVLRPVAVLCFQLLHHRFAEDAKEKYKTIRWKPGESDYMVEDPGLDYRRRWKMLSSPKRSDSLWGLIRTADGSQWGKPPIRKANRGKERVELHLYPPVLHVVERYNSIFVFTKPLSQGARHPDRESTLPPPKIRNTTKYKAKVCPRKGHEGTEGE